MKGIILAGGAGTRLHPLTQVVSKQLLPVYDKPMIYYPLSVLMLADIREILIITTPRDLQSFQNLLGDGSQIGLKLHYAVQEAPEGLAQAFIIGKEFLGTSDVCLILGDNIFYGSGLQNLLKEAKRTVEEESKAVVFGYYVSDPERYGVAAFNDHNEVEALIEKPENPPSNYAVVGLYFYPNDVVQKAAKVVPSERGELEITHVNQQYLEEKRLSLQKLGRGYVWLDTGTHSSLSDATEYVQVVEARTGLKIACLEEIAYYKKWIDRSSLLQHIEGQKSQYFEYIRQVLNK